MRTKRTFVGRTVAYEFIRRAVAKHCECCERRRRPRSVLARLRNYELEEELRDLYGGRWVISQWCPFDYIFCEWTKHAPDKVIRKEQLNLAKHREELASKLNVDYCIAYLATRGSSRPCPKLPPELRPPQP